jgi:hypothetical protein
MPRTQKGDYNDLLDIRGLRGRNTTDSTPTIRMKFRDIADPMIELAEDAAAAEKYLDECDNQFARRAYIRSTFAFLESEVWLLKKVCLTIPGLQGAGEKPLSHAEYALLQDHTYELGGNGDPLVRPKHLKLRDNLRFTFNVFNRLFSSQIDLGVGTGSWDTFLDAVAIRNRITHPKNAANLSITDDEIQTCRKMQSWFNGMLLTLSTQY